MSGRATEPPEGAFPVAPTLRRWAGLPARMRKGRAGDAVGMAGGVYRAGGYGVGAGNRYGAGGSSDSARLPKP
jgi:hypothetical protein